MGKNYRDQYQKVSFCIYGKHLIPDEITKKLQMKPDLVCVRGYVRGKSGKRFFRPVGQWNLDSHLRRSNIYSQVESLLNLLMPKKRILKALLKEHTGEIHITRCPHVDIGLLNLLFKPEILKMCGELGIELLISVMKWDSANSIWE